jgi:hypothetical protein
VAQIRQSAADQVAAFYFHGLVSCLLRKGAFSHALMSPPWPARRPETAAKG